MGLTVNPSSQELKSLKLLTAIVPCSFRFAVELLAVLVMRPEYETLKGTTTLGIKSRDGVVLAADKRATAGQYIAGKTVQKIAKINERCALTVAGSVAEAFQLVDRLKAEASLYELSHGRIPKIHTLANFTALTINTKKFISMPVQLLLAGYDDSPRLYMIDFFGSLSEEEYISTGSGSRMALGSLIGKRVTELSLAETEEAAVAAIGSAIEWDTATGEGIDLATISKSGMAFRTVTLHHS